MSRPDVIEVEVEALLPGRRRDSIVVVRPLSTPFPKFSVTPTTTIGGTPVIELVQPPRKCDRDGSARLDVVAFRVRDVADDGPLKPGARVTIARFRRLDT